MKVLLIGGTRFLGRAIVASCLKRNHDITLFNRGKSNPDLFPDIKQIRGDRDGEIDKLGNIKYDVVIDTCGYIPRIVRQSVQFMKGKVKTYVFISSVSVYKESNIPFLNENAEVIELEDPIIEDINATADSYGGLKVLCEREVLNVFENNSLIIRPGLIVGPHDPTNRFTYWSVRVRKGGDILCPGDGTMPVQFIDVRDLANFTLDLIEKGATGPYNVCGPQTPVFLKDLLELFRNKTGSTARFHWVNNEWLINKKVGPWMEMPLWIPTEIGEAMMQQSIKKSLNEGLKFRDTSDTIRDILTWYDSIGGDTKQWPAGMDSTREKNLLEDLLPK